LAERSTRWKCRTLSQAQGIPEPPPRDATKKPTPSPTGLPSIIVGVVIAFVAASIWYLARPQPLLVQGKVDATRFDIAARVDGRVAEIPVIRGQGVVPRLVSSNLARFAGLYWRRRHMWLK